MMLTQFEIVTITDDQAEGTGVYWAVIGPMPGAPWEQTGFKTREDAESARELLNKLFAQQIGFREALEEIAAPMDCGCSGGIGHGCGQDGPAVQGLQEIARQALSIKQEKS